MDESGHVHKKASSEILFAEYGRNYEDGEDPTQENLRVIDLYDPVDAMSMNREKDKLVVCGIRGVLQIVKIQTSSTDVVEGPSIVKDLDMRAYRKGRVNILYSAQNVRWNQIYDQYIATTSSNGSIVCWNVNRKNKSVYKAHERSATCLDWHSTAPYILVSGSRDCAVKSYDLRAKDTHQLTFRLSESVRDVAMCKAPGFDDYFFSADDGGVLRLWDLRQTKRNVFQKVAHRSFIATLSLNPNNRSLIATGGGRDKLVKVWEWTGPEMKRVSVIETTAPLGRVVWRPDRPNQIATCASVNETTVNVWDIRRPYLPYVTYDEHCDSVTDACWPNTEYDVFLSCGKDGLLVLHNIDSGHAPITYACDGAFDITPDGIMAVAVNSEVHERNDAEMEAKVAPVSEKKQLRKIPYETFDEPVKSLIGFGIPESLTHSLPPNTFYKIAERYHIGGMDIVALCEINSKVSRKAGMEHVAQTWKLVEALCAQARIQEEYDKMSAEEKLRIIKAWIVRKKELAEEGRRWLGNLDDMKRADIKKIVRERLENTQHVTAFLNFSSGSDSENNSDQDIEIKDRPDEEPKQENPGENEEEKEKRRKKKKRVTFTDFYFGGGESNFNEIGGKKELLHLNEFMGLRNEAFDIRDEVAEAKFFCKARKQPTTEEEYERDLKKAEAEFQAWSPMLEIYRLLQYHAEQGDMQTCATVSMVCGKRLFDAVDPYTINGWIMCYMEMLDRLELFLVCAKIRKYCPLESISSVSRENTTIQLAHSDCNAIMVNGRCSKCEKPAHSDCTVCRGPIIGLTYQCNICGHAMHCDHAYEWFQKTVECAYVGCPCTCGQNTWPDMERTFLPNDDNPRPHRKFKRDPNAENPKELKVVASRFDSDSDGFEEEQDLEFSTQTQEIRKKYGMKVKNEAKPWTQHLARLYQARKDSLKEQVVVEKRISEEEETMKKDEERERMIQVLETTLVKHEDELLDFENQTSSLNGINDKEYIDNSSVVERLMDSSEEEFEDEEDDDGDDDPEFDEQEIEEQAYRKLRYQLEGIVEEEVENDDEPMEEEYREDEGGADFEAYRKLYDPMSVRERLMQNGSYQYEERFFPRAPPNTQSEDQHEPDVKISKEVVVNGYVYENGIVHIEDYVEDGEEYGDNVYIEGHVKLRDIHGDSEEVCGIPKLRHQLFSGDYEEDDEDYDEEVYDEEFEGDEQVDEEDYEDEEVYDEEEEYEDEEDEQVEDEEVYNGVHCSMNGSKTARDLEEDFKVLRRLTFDDSSEPDHTEAPPSESKTLMNLEVDCTEKVENPEKTVKDRVLAVLSMTKEEMKRARRYNKLKAIEGTEDIFEEDEYAVTSDDSASFYESTSASSSSRDNLARPDWSVPAPADISPDSLLNTESLPTSTSSDDLSMLGRQSPTSVVTCDVYEGRSNEYQHSVHKMIDLRKDSDEKETSSEAVFIAISGAAPPSSSSSAVSTPSISPTPSFPSFATRYILSQSPPPPPPEHFEDEPEAVEELPLSSEELEASEIEDSVPALETLPITSRANPTFSARRPPLSNPVQIQVNGQPSDRRNGSHSSFSSLFRNTENAHSVPADMGLCNPLFGQCSTSLPAQNYVPTRRMRYNTVHTEMDFDYGNGHFSSHSNGFLSADILENGCSSHPSWGSRHNSTQSLAGSVEEVEPAQELREDTPIPYSPPQSFISEPPPPPPPKPRKFIGMEIIPDLPDYLNPFETDFLQQAFLETQRTLEEQNEESDDSTLFSTDDEQPEKYSDEEEHVYEDEEEPFFPQIEDVPRASAAIHPWETQEQYEKRVHDEEEEERMEREELEAQKAEAQRAAEEEEGSEDGLRLSPMERALARLREQRDFYKATPETIGRFESEAKRVRFDETMHEQAMDVALKNLKEFAEPQVDSDFEMEESEVESVDEEVCLRCKHQIKRDKEEKEYLRWIRNSGDHGQMILVKSFDDPCSAFQLSHLDGHLTDVEVAKQEQKTFVEFVELFYFVKWDRLLLPDNEFMLKEVYEMWDDFRRKRPRVCDEHYLDFTFRFFTSSIAVKIKQTLYSQESLKLKRDAVSFDWAHLKPCVVTMDDDTSDIDRIFQADVQFESSWTSEERIAAREYWNIFGTVPLHIMSSNKNSFGPEAESKLEIIDDTNYWTKKMLRSIMYNRRNRDIKLSYTKTKKRDDMFRVQKDTREVLTNRWKTRLDQMINETPHFDFQSNTIRIRTKEGLIHSDDAYNPYPMCQIDDGEHYVTIRPLVAKKFIELKSRIRSKFHIPRRAVSAKGMKNFNVTKEDIRKTQSYKRFEPKLKRAEELTAMLSKHFKVVDRKEIVTHYELYTIVEEDEEVSLIVELLERQRLMGEDVLDPEEIFADRRETREVKERAILAKMEEEKYRKTLANTHKLDCARISMLKKNWAPRFRKILEKARRAMLVGKALVDEDIQKWMEYKYEMSFVKKSVRRKSLVTKAQMKQIAPPKWQDAIDELNFDEPSFPPPYLKIPEKPSSELPSPKLPSFNSSSEDEEEEEKIPIQYETCVDLVGVAAKLQDEFEERNKLADRDEDWEYSDDSSVSTWFGDDCDDIVNRLINPDYMDEHMILKERSTGPLAKKLWEVIEEREESDPETDEEEGQGLKEIEMETRLEEEKDEAEHNAECEYLGDYRHVGVADGKKTKQLAEKELEMDLRRSDEKGVRELEIQQLRYFFQQYRLDHSYTFEPFEWNDVLREPIASLHRNELRRVANRIHKKMKEEYEEVADMDEMICKEVPVDENGLHFKIFNVLLFGKPEQSFKDAAKDVDEANRILKPLKQYELFFGSEGVVKLQRVHEEVIQCMNIKSSIKYLCNQFGKNGQLSKEKLIGFLKLWWVNSPHSLQNFVRICEDAYVHEEILEDDLFAWDYCTEHMEVVLETVDNLEIGLMMNDILYIVDMYVEDTQALFEHSTNSEDQIAFSSMDIWDWHEVKYGRPYLYRDLGEARKKLLDSETEESSEEDETQSGSEEEEDVEDEDFEDEEVGEEEVGNDEEGEFPVEEAGCELPSSEEDVSPIDQLNQESDPELSSPEIRIETIDLLDPDPVILRKHLMEHYRMVYKELKLAEAEKKERRAEDNARKLLEEWDGYADDQEWEVDDIGRKIHEYLAMNKAVQEDYLEEEEEEEASEVFESWKKEFEKIKTGEIDEPEIAFYAKGDITRHEMLEMCGLPISLDHELFIADMELCQSDATSIADASELAEAIEEGFEESECEIPTSEIDEDAQSYCSVKHVLRHELYFQREVQSRHTPSCIVICSAVQFFEDQFDHDLDYKKWRRIIEASDSPYSFNRLVMRERLIKKCRDEFCIPLINEYFGIDDRQHSQIQEVLRGCLIVTVVDTEMSPWVCRVVSRTSVAKPAHNRKTYIRKKMVEDSQRDLIIWLRENKIDMDVYSRCPVIVDREGPLSLEDSERMTSILMEDEVRDDWFSIWKDEGVKALDAIIRMPPPPKDKLAGYKAIFKPIFDTWYDTWKYENNNQKVKTILKRKPNRVKEYLHKARIIVNYAHQHYRMKRFDNLLTKDPTGFHTIDRSDVPSASLFDSLDAAVTKFCDEDSPHLKPSDKLIVRDGLIQLATGKIPNFSINYSGATDYTQDQNTQSQSEDEPEEDSPPQPFDLDMAASRPVEEKTEKKPDVDEIDEEYEWLREMYEENDMDKRRFMARMLFEIAQKAMYRFAPNLANFEVAKKKFQHLLTLHARQRPLLDMMLTKVRGTYFMPLETNMFMYQQKLLTFGELVESEIHPKDLRNQKYSLEKLRRQEPRDAQQMSDFLDGLVIDTESDESGSDVSSDPSSLSGSTESLDLIPEKKKKKKKSKKDNKKTAAKVQRDEMVHKLRSKPNDPDVIFAAEKRALGPKRWRTRRKINDMLEGIADVDKSRIKLSNGKEHLLDHVTKLIIENSDTAHWSWGELQMRTRINRIPPIHRMKQKHVEMIEKGMKSFQTPKKYNSKSKEEDGRKWF